MEKMENAKTIKTKLSERTIKAYTREIEKFEKNFQQLYGNQPEKATDEQINAYILKCYPDLISSNSSLAIHYAAIKYWYNQTFQKNLQLPVPYPSTHSAPQRILEKEELDALFENTRNHICGIMIRLIYGSGIRLHEIVRIRVGDVNFEELRIQLRNEDDEISHSTIFPGSLKFDLMRETYGKSEADFLFSLRKGSSGEYVPVSRRTLQHYLAKSAEALNLGKVTTQTLRDNFAIHLIQKGVNPKKLMKLMGYKNIRSVLRYTRLVPDSDIRVSSPLSD